MTTPALPPLSHDQAQHYLLDGRDQLARAEREALHAHLADCPDCQTYGREVTALQIGLTRALHARWDGAHAADDSMLRLKLRITARNQSQRVRDMVSTLTSVAALAAVVLLAVLALNNAGLSTSTAQPNAQRREPLTVINLAQSVTGTVGTVNLPVAIGDRIRLIDFDLASDQLVPGSAVDLTLRWQTQFTMTDGYIVFMNIVDAQGNFVAQLDAVPADGVRPTPSWLPGETIIDRHVLMLPITVAPGEYRLLIGLYSPYGGWHERTSLGGDAIQVATLHVSTIPHRLDVNLEKFAALLGYSLEISEFKPGQYLAVTLYWQARDNTLASYQSFVHLMRVDDQTPIAMSDSIPGAGLRPTPTWYWGETVPDPHLLQLPDNLPPGQYNLVAGLYDTQTGARLSTVTGDNVIVVTQLTAN